MSSDKLWKPTPGLGVSLWGGRGSARAGFFFSRRKKINRKKEKTSLCSLRTFFKCQEGQMEALTVLMDVIKAERKKH